MKVTLLLLAVLSVVVSVCVALPYAGKQEDSAIFDAALPRLPRSPAPEDKKKDERRGSFHTGIHDESGVGLTAKVQGKGTIYQSDDAKSKVNVEGSWSKVLDGPQRGKPQHQGGISWDVEW